MEPYKSLYPNAYVFLTETERVAAQVITLPTGQVITPEIIGRVTSVIRTALKSADEIRKHLKAKPAAS